MNVDISNTVCDFVLPTYIIYLQDRSDGPNHIFAEFRGRNEFTLHIVDDVKHPNNSLGHWLSVVKAVKLARENGDDVIIIADDNHVFTSYYHKSYLIENIFDANESHALILSGGNAGFDNVIPLNESRYWVDTLMSTQFLILFNGLFDKIINYRFKSDDTVASVLSEITSHKMLLFPFISKGQNSDPSDVVSVSSNDQGLISNVFEEAEKRLSRIQNAYMKYVKIPKP